MAAIAVLSTALFFLFSPVSLSKTIVGEPRVLGERMENLAEPAPSEIFAPSASILHVGDIMIDRNVKKRIDKFGEEYLLGALAEQDFFSGADVVAGNLEGPFADSRRKTTKEIAFRFDPALLPMLTQYGFSLFSTANNHSLDMSRKGLAESIKHLADAGVSYYGGDGYTVKDDSLLFKDINGIRLAFVGVNETFQSMNVKKTLELLRKGEQEADHTIVNIHWGAEYKPLSNTKQRTLAHQFIDAGADVIIGHHPHVVQEVEIYKDRPVFYSLGNFIFDQYFSPETQQGLAVKTVFSSGTLALTLYPLQSVESQVKKMEGVAAEEFMKKLFERSRLGEYVVGEEFSLKLDT